MDQFWQFINKVYDGEEGGIGLLLAFCVVVGAIAQITTAVIKRAKK